MRNVTLEKIKKNEHVLGIFEKDEEIMNAMSFLKVGFDNNEAVMLITDQISKDEIRDGFTNIWKVGDIDTLEANKNIILKTPQEWYFPEGRVEPKRIITQWNDWVNIIQEFGRSGLRVFADMSPFFKHGFERELIKYETSLELKFSGSLTAICAYTHKDIAKLGDKGYRDLIEHHHPIIMG